MNVNRIKTIHASKCITFIVCLSVLIAVIGSQPALGKGVPTSAEQLRSEVESALKAKNTKALMALFNWDEIQEKDDVKMLMKMAFDEGWKGTNKVVSVKLSPLPPRYKGTNEIFSLRTRDNVSALGMVDVDCTDKDCNDHLTYGTKGGAFYLAQTVRETIPGRSLRVTVSVFAPPITYTGACVYVKEGKEISMDLSGTNKYIEKNLWGDYIKSCAIQKTTTSGMIMLEIAEDHKKIFQSPQIKTEDPIHYEGKPPGKPLASIKTLPTEKEIARQEKKDWERELPVDVSYRMGDDCILVFQNYSKKNLSLTVTAKDEINNLWREDPHPTRTNSCQFDLAGSATKDTNLLAGWRITTDDRIRVEIVNPKYDTSYIYITDTHTTSHRLAEQQEAIFKAYNQTNDAVEKDRDAHILSNLWHDGLLEDAIKTQLVQDHYQLVLRQISTSDGSPSFEVNCSQTFPFPNVSTEFMPTRFLNNQPKWFPGESAQSYHGLGAMSQTSIISEFASGHSEKGFIQYTHMIGEVPGGWYPSEYKNGDVVQFQMNLIQTVNGRSWQTSLKSNKIVLQGLKY